MEGFGCVSGLFAIEVLNCQIYFVWCETLVNLKQVCGAPFVIEMLYLYDDYLSCFSFKFFKILNMYQNIDLVLQKEIEGAAAWGFCTVKSWYFPVF